MNIKLTDKQLWALVWALKLALHGIKKVMKSKKGTKDYDALCELSTHIISVQTTINNAVKENKE